MLAVTVDGSVLEVKANERLIDIIINRSGSKLPQVCYHPQLGPIQTCDTCIVEIDGELVRACANTVLADINVRTNSAAATEAQRQAVDRILSNHLLYCTVCDNSNGNCAVHNTTRLLGIEHQNIPFREKPYEVDNTNPFYRYDPDQCILCGRCVEACQNLEVNETLSINWEDPHPRGLWDGGAPIGECTLLTTTMPCAEPFRISAEATVETQDYVEDRLFADCQDDRTLRLSRAALLFQKIMTGENGNAHALRSWGLLCGSATLRGNQQKVER